jgi:REP element-mobilizing transposase RayT
MTAHLPADTLVLPPGCLRPLRVAGALHHVAARHADGQALFRTVADRDHLDRRVGELLRLYQARAHAYCWMTNHVHLALEIEPGAAESFQQDLASSLAITDHQGPPLRVDARPYLLRLVRYVHLNPVMAGLVRDAADWPWSGHRAYLGEPGVPWLAVDLVLRLLGGDLLTATAAYRAYVRPAGITAEERR